MSKFDNIIVDLYDLPHDKSLPIELTYRFEVTANHIYCSAEAFEQLRNILEENKKLKEALVIAREALIFCAKRKHCREYSCCASCGPIYKSEEALEKIEALGVNDEK